jgi:hypothetical protein
MDGSNEPLLGDPNERNDPRTTIHEGRSYDLPPLQPSMGFSRTIPSTPPDPVLPQQGKAGMTEDDQVVGERSESFI